MSILQMSISIPTPPRNLSSSKVFSDQTHFSLLSKFSHLSLNITIPKSPFPTIIRMGGGPRTYPGGVSKWQWKRMQAKKGKQLLKARLARERQIYEMRKRAELKAAISELERPWEVVKEAPKLFSATADQQLQVLADRFQKPGGFDLWSEKDGPQLFQTVDGVSSSARFFPKGVVNSVKPYERIGDNSDNFDEFGNGVSDLGNGRQEKTGVSRSGFKKNLMNGSDADGVRKNNLLNQGKNGAVSDGKSRKTWGRRRRISVTGSSNTSIGVDSGAAGLDYKKIKRYGEMGKDGHLRRGTHSRELGDSNAEVYDTSLQDDGSYRFQKGRGKMNEYGK